MAYEFYCDPAGSDNNSGSGQSTSADWTGTVNCSGTTTISKASGADFPAGAAGQFIRIDPGGANDSNLRIVSRDSATQLTATENGPNVSGATSNIGGAFASLQAMDDNVPSYAASGSVDADVNLNFIGTHNLAVTLTLDNNTTDLIRRRLIGKGLSAWDDGSKPIIDFGGTANRLTLPATGGDTYSLIDFEIRNNTYANGLVESVGNADGTYCRGLAAHNSTGRGISIENYYGLIVACEVYDTTGYAVYLRYGHMVGCYVHDEKANQIGIYIERASAVRCVVENYYRGIYLVSGGLAFACTCHSCTYPFSSSTARTNQSAINSLLSGTNGFQNSAGTLTLGSKGNNALAGRDLKYHPDPTSDDFDSTLETLTSAVLAEDSSWWNTGWRGGVPSAVWDDTYTSPGAHGKPYEMGRRRTRRGVFANPTQTTI